MSFKKVGIKPKFVEGNDAYNEYLKTNLVYPEIAKKNKIEGTVLINITIDADEKISDLKVLRPLEGSCTEEALRFVKSMPNWEPGVLKGNKVSVSMDLPIKFKI
jgi:TonB family protein